MMAVRPCSRRGSSSLIASRRSRLHCPCPGKKRLPPALKQLQQLLTKGLQATAALWPPLQRAMNWCIRPRRFLPMTSNTPGAQVRERYLAHVSQMQEQKAEVGPLGEAIDHFAHITGNFAAGLFHCYDVKGLPRTNNELEHCFGVARVHERRATGPTRSHSWRGGSRFSPPHGCCRYQAAPLLCPGPATYRLSALA